MIIDKTKPDPGESYALPKIELVIPDAHKQQLQQAIITLVTVLLSIVLTLSAQVVSQAIGGPDPLPTDPLIALGTTHFADLAITGDVAAGGDITAGGDLTIDGVTYTATDPLTITGVLTDVVLLHLQNE